jgi:hypothetical protein
LVTLRDFSFPRELLMPRDLVAKCAVEGCKNPACVEVILYDVYPLEKHVFFERDFTCPLLCSSHMVENEQKAHGTREPRGTVSYPYSNQDRAQGFTIYRPLHVAFTTTL